MKKLSWKKITTLSATILLLSTAIPLPAAAVSDEDSLTDRTNSQSTALFNGTGYSAETNGDIEQDTDESLPASNAQTDGTNSGSQSSTETNNELSGSSEVSTDESLPSDSGLPNETNPSNTDKSNESETDGSSQTLPNEQGSKNTSASSDESLIGQQSVEQTVASEYKYFTVTTQKPVVYQNENLDLPFENSADLYQKTFNILGQLTSSAGARYYRLQVGDIVVFIRDEDGKTTNFPAGSELGASGYATVTTKGIAVWKNIELNAKASTTTDIFQRTFKVTGKLSHVDGTVYYKLSGQGFVSQNALQTTNEAQGARLTFNKYVSISSQNYSVWKNFKWQELTPSKKIYQQTLYAKYKYAHSNGAIYYELYRPNGSFAGIINSSATKSANNQGGIWYKENLYANKKGGTYTLWQDLNFSKKRGSSTSFAKKTVKISGKYYHYNGSTYYSLYDNKGNWLGYINASGVSTSKNKQGTYQNFNKYVTVTNKNYATWSSFAFKGKAKKPATYQWTYKAKGVYYHYNGSSYYSLYDKNNKWVGYINTTSSSVAQNGGGTWQKENLQRKIVKKNYTIWQDLAFKTKRSNTNNHYGKQYTVKGKYRHFNGSLYYSLYSGSKWIGYVNATATGSPFTIYSTKAISRYQVINNKSGNFYSKADPSSSKKAAKSNYYKYMVRAIKEASTSDGTYYLVELAGSGTDLGWIKANQTYSVQDSFYMYQTGGPFPSLNVKNLNIKVSISKQRIYIRSGSSTIYTMMCSTGLPGTPTPLGNFKIQAERGPWFWGANGGAAYYRSFHGHGIYLFHSVTITGPGRVGSYYHPEAMKLGKRASHGCIRMAVPDSIWFYNNIPNNTPVSIVN